MLRLRYTVDGEEKIATLSAPEVRLGRSSDNDVVLPDYSVSRRHAALRRDGDRWFVLDLKSTNGVEVNRVNVQKAQIHPGDRLKVGIFELDVEGEEPESPATVSPAGRGTPSPERSAASPSRLEAASALSNATIVRSLSEFTADYGLDGCAAGAQELSAVRRDKRKALDEAYASQVFGFLTRLARLLLTADSVDEVLERVMEIAFEALPVDRGFILLRDEESGEVECQLVRHGDRVTLRPTDAVPISKTMLESVMRERVALLTYDALSDQRLKGTESVRIHQIRAAMCAPLWSGERIMGVMQVDTPHHAGSFTEQDVDLLTALANYCAVTIERLENARQVEYERQVRSRLERYHSPAVIEAVMNEDPAASGDRIRRLKQADVTVLFCDLVGFTAFSEQAEPEAVTELMESFFTHAVEAIFSAGGTLDKFIGDCVMAFFGAPMPQADHADRAVEAAVRIQEALDDWNAERAAASLPTVVTRIALNSGPVVVGDIGSNRRVDYTVLGNTVNVAARLEESVCRPGDIVLGDATRRQLSDRVATEPLGEFQLKGLQQRVTAHRVMRP